MRISDWSSDVCSYDLTTAAHALLNVFTLRINPNAPNPTPIHNQYTRTPNKYPKCNTIITTNHINITTNHSSNPNKLKTPHKQRYEERRVENETVIHCRYR